jgi:hypothetical protein
MKIYLNPDTIFTTCDDDRNVNITIRISPAIPSPIIILGIPIGKHWIINKYIMPNANATIVTIFSASKI